MLTEQDYKAVLEELGFDLQGVEPGTKMVGTALRHTIRQFVGIPGRNADAADAFWPTLYWKRSGDFFYLLTPQRDADHFRSLFWAPAPPDLILEYQPGEHCFVPVLDTRAGLRLALESLFLSRFV